MDSKTFVEKGKELPFFVIFSLLLVYKKARPACLFDVETVEKCKKIYGDIFVYTKGFISLEKIKTYKEFIEDNKDKDNNYYIGKILGYNCYGQNIGKDKNNTTGTALNYGFSDNGKEFKFTWQGKKINGKIYSEICQEIPNFKKQFNKFKKIAKEIDLDLSYIPKDFPFIKYKPNGMFISGKRKANYFDDVVKLIKNNKINCFISHRGAKNIEEITFYDDDYQKTYPIIKYISFDNLYSALKYAKLKNILPFANTYKDAEKYIRENYPQLREGCFLIYFK